MKPKKPKSNPTAKKFLLPVNFIYPERVTLLEVSDKQEEGAENPKFDRYLLVIINLFYPSFLFFFLIFNLVQYVLR